MLLLLLLLLLLLPSFVAQACAVGVGDHGVRLGGSGSALSDGSLDGTAEACHPSDRARPMVKPY